MTLTRKDHPANFSNCFLRGEFEAKINISEILTHSNSVTPGVWGHSNCTLTQIGASDIKNLRQLDDHRLFSHAELNKTYCKEAGCKRSLTA